MTDNRPLGALIGVVGGLIVAWLILVLVLVVARPRGATLNRATVTQAARLLPDLIRLLSRLARDPALPRGVRIRIGVVLAYLALPIDVIPDVIPVLGYADDLIVVLIALRSVLRAAGPDAVRTHWPGTTDGCDLIMQLVGGSHRAPPAQG